MMGGNLQLADQAVAVGLAEASRFADVIPNACDLLRLSGVLVQAFSGRVPDARAASKAHLAEAQEKNPSARGMWRLVLAIIELHGGSPARAWKLVTDARRDLVWRDIAGLLPTADALSAAIAARTGRFAIARTWLDGLAGTVECDPKVALYAGLARAWVGASAGRPGYSIRTLGPVIARAIEKGHLYLAGLAAYEGVRIEPIVGSTVMLPHLIAAGDAFPVQLRHARAVVARASVLPVARELAEAGFLGPAIDAARWAAENAASDAPLASEANRLADSWTVRTGVSMSARRAQSHPRVTPLTDREWQLASGAAAHRTSAELAAEYGISVRTVDNHLARIYKKLGITGRRELSGELSELQAENPYRDTMRDAATNG
jgi:DNA-binding CsgD family transcriptional regulator